MQVVPHDDTGPVVVHVLGVLLLLSGEADVPVCPVHGALHLTHALIPVQTSSRICLSNSGDTESGFWGEAGSGSF